MVGFMGPLTIPAAPARMTARDRWRPWPWRQEDAHVGATPRTRNDRVIAAELHSPRTRSKTVADAVTMIPRTAHVTTTAGSASDLGLTGSRPASREICLLPARLECAQFESDSGTGRLQVAALPAASSADLAIDSKSVRVVRYGPDIYPRAGNFVRHGGSVSPGNAARGRGPDSAVPIVTKRSAVRAVSATKPTTANPSKGRAPSSGE